MEEENIALWGIFGILLCLFFTCYAIVTRDLKKRAAALITGVVATTAWALAFRRRYMAPDDFGAPAL
jgi:uncharacterized BrkB/YihY/UPF0761 family membrane protein